MQLRWKIQNFLFLVGLEIYYLLLFIYWHYVVNSLIMPPSLLLISSASSTKHTSDNLVCELSFCSHLVNTTFQYRNYKNVPNLP